MRNFFALFFVILFLTACGGGSAGNTNTSSPTGSTLPAGTVTGVGFDGLLMNSTISIYDFSNGTKGGLLAQALSDNNGVYTISLQVQSRPILIEATGGYYTEEAGSSQVQLPANYKLSAVTNFVIGSTPTIAITSFTHLAAGLAAYEIKQGTLVSTAIDDANNRISGMTGVDILATSPKPITDPANASAVITPELRYGFLSGAISMWTYTHTPNTGLAHKIPFTSIDFAQLMYQDVVADGLLDGKGFDSTGTLSQLSYGTTLLTSDVYRLELGISLLQMANDPNNKTGLNNAAVLPYVQSYVGSIDSIFNHIIPTPITPPVVAITAPAANAVLMKTVSVGANVTTPALLSTVEFLVDGVTAGTATNPASPSYSLVTTAYADGPHTLGVRATDIGGQVTVSTIPVLIVNNVPSVTISSPAGNAVISGVTSVLATTQSSIGLNTVQLLVDGIAVGTATNLISPAFSLLTTAYPDGAHTIGIRATDIGGQVTISSVPVVIANIAPVVNITAPTAGAILSGSLNVTATASSGAGLSSVQLLIDGVSAGSATNLTSPSFPLATTATPDGVHVLGVRATDVGGRSTTSTASVIFDNIAPVVTITAPSASAFVNGVVNVTATASSVAGLASSSLLVDNVLIGASVSSTSPSFSINSTSYLDGAHSIAVRSIDVGGLTTTSTIPVVFNNVPASITITSPAANSAAGRTITVSAVTSSTIGLSKVEMLIDGVVTATASSLQSPSFTLVTTNYADGSHTVGVRTTDLANQVVTKTISVLFDNTPPATGTAQEVYSYNPSAFTVSGTVFDSGSGVASVVWYASGAATPYSTTTIGSNGAWSITPAYSMVNQTYGICVTDKVGYKSYYTMNSASSVGTPSGYAFSWTFVSNTCP